MAIAGLARHDDTTGECRPGQLQAKICQIIWTSSHTRTFSLSVSYCAGTFIISTCIRSPVFPARPSGRCQGYRMSLAWFVAASSRIWRRSTSSTATWSASRPTACPSSTRTRGKTSTRGNQGSCRFQRTCCAIQRTCASTGPRKS